ncbi:hypothetical protein ACGFZB_28905 [Streptomyces cinerochromogenes]|uniref:Uncharacterized protein n=1 Tax=Streptomyces cinerochromogenes TaxID=66422 RepID=A0ABW7BAZ0_9ACTN
MAHTTFAPTALDVFRVYEINPNAIYRDYVLAPACHLPADMDVRLMDIIRDENGTKGVVYVYKAGYAAKHNLGSGYVFVPKPR